MPSETYSPTFPDLHPEDTSAATRMREGRLARGTQAARDAFNKVPEQHQQNVQNKLKQLQNTAPILPAEAAKAFMKGRPTIGLVRSFFGLFAQINWSVDWLFIILASFALLKDIFDIVLAGLATATSWISLIPIIGQIAATGATAMGETVTFVLEILLLCLTAVVLALTGGSWKDRSMAKYFIGIALGFIAEAFPGISWLPLAFIEVIIIYGFVLMDRASMAETNQLPESGQQSSAENIPPSGSAADSYAGAQERMAA